MHHPALDGCRLQVHPPGVAPLDRRPKPSALRHVALSEPVQDMDGQWSLAALFGVSLEELFADTGRHPCRGRLLSGDAYADCDRGRRQLACSPAHFAVTAPHVAFHCYLPAPVSFRRGGPKMRSRGRLQ